ncbi:MAG TPA: universal stress protein [Polyangiaceae bacterium]|nr:universal stress protein [Polyangiaceae bacterium]
MNSKTAAMNNKPCNIVVGFDFSELSERALREALELAARRPPTVLRVVVVGLPSTTMLLLPGSTDPVPEAVARDRVRKRVTEIIDEYHATRGPTGVSEVCVYVLPGLSSANAGHLIAEVAKHVDAEAVVVGSHGRRGLDRVLLGSVAEHVVREAPASVFVIRPPDFVRGEKVPAIEPPLAPGEPHLKTFTHPHTYHYADKSEEYTRRTMPAI